jgi:hypothetical protein
MPNGVEIESDRVRMIVELPEPTCHCNIQVFLSFANFYRHFIRPYLRLAKPMRVVLEGKKNGRFLRPFIPTLAMKWPFAELRNAFTKASVLAHFDAPKSICLETDASGFAITGIIS